MRRAIHGQRFPRFVGDEAARFLQMNGIAIKHHKKQSEELKCPLCWDEYEGRPSAACDNCINGYLKDIRSKRGYVATIQSNGNFGIARTTFKAGGQHERVSSYIYMDFLNGRGVDIGDSLVYNNKGFKQQVTVLNKQPQVSSGGEISMFVFECATPMDKDVQGMVN